MIISDDEIGPLYLSSLITKVHEVILQQQQQTLEISFVIIPRLILIRNVSCVFINVVYELHQIADYYL